MGQRKFVKIAEFCDTGSGTTPSRQKLEAYYGGGIPWVKSGELREGVITKTEESVTELALKETSLKLVPSGALLVAMYGATVGRVGRLGIEATTNQAICHIVPDPLVADQQYMFHALCAKASELVAKGVGGAQPNISQGTIRETELYLPPLEEQKRIAAILDQADDIRRKRQHAIDRLNQLGQAIFHEMFGDPVTNPMGWPVFQLGDVVRSGDKINYGVVQPGEDVEEGIPLIRVGDLLSGHINPANVKQIDPVIEENYKRSRLVGDEILIGCVGSIGSVALAHEGLRGANIARAVARVPVDPKIASREFIAEQIKSPFVQRYFAAETRTVAQPTLNIGLIVSAPIIIPPLDEQGKFSAAVSDVRIQLSAMMGHASRTDSLFTSLQHRAFTGQL